MSGEGVRSNPPNLPVYRSDLAKLYSIQHRVHERRSLKEGTTQNMHSPNLLPMEFCLINRFDSSVLRHMYVDIKQLGWDKHRIFILLLTICAIPGMKYLLPALHQTGCTVEGLWISSSSVHILAVFFIKVEEHHINDIRRGAIQVSWTASSSCRARHQLQELQDPFTHHQQHQQQHHCLH